MRKTMTREVTKTTVKLARMEVQDGLPVTVPMEDEILLGNVQMEKAQKLMRQKHGDQVTVFSIAPDTTVYEMALEDFIKHATVKEPQQEQE